MTPPPTLARPETRQAFAHVLRGLAALTVLVGHYLYTFHAQHAGIAALLGVPALSNLPPLPSLLASIGEYGILLGQFGVGVFFLISGYVIPFALRYEDRPTFLVRRTLRIFPVYIVGFSFVAVSLWLLNRAVGTTMPYQLDHLAAHLGVVTLNLLGYTRVDGISWTLEVEVYFYLAMTLLGARVLRVGLLPWVAVAACLAYAALARVAISPVQGLQFWAAMLLVIGIGYHAWDRGHLRRRDFLALHAVVALLGLFVWYRFDRAIFNAQWLAGYVLAMATFAACFALRARFRAWRLPSFLADISYPLYVVHALPGYVVLYWVTAQTGSILLATTAAVAMALGVATALHYVVERPVLARAKRLSNRARAGEETSAVPLPVAGR